MLSYQHIYHAGNFADVQKHAILAAVLQAMTQRPGPLCVLDTHAGRGLYALTSTEAERNREFEGGIDPVWKNRADLPALAPYLKIVEKYNAGQENVTRYPGSALIAREMLKATDALIAVERHPGEYRELQQSLAGKAQTTLTQSDGLKVMLDNVPMPGKRGIVVIDPSYEIKTDYADVATAVHQAWKKWPQGVFIIWYPIMEAAAHITLLTKLRTAGLRDVLVSEIRLDVPPQEHYRMFGSGVAVINPPWREQTMADITRQTARGLGGNIEQKIFWLDNIPINPETGTLSL